MRTAHFPRQGFLHTLRKETLISTHIANKRRSPVLAPARETSLNSAPSTHNTPTPTTKPLLNHLSDKYGNAILAPSGHYPNTLIVPPPNTPYNTLPPNRPLNHLSNKCALRICPVWALPPTNLPLRPSSATPHPLPQLPSPPHNKTSFNHLSDKYGNAILAPIGLFPLRPQQQLPKAPAPHKKKSRQSPVSSFLLQKIFANLA